MNAFDGSLYPKLAIAIRKTNYIKIKIMNNLYNCSSFSDLSLYPFTGHTT